MVKNLSGKPFPAFDIQRYDDDFTPTKKPDEMRKPTHEMPNILDKWNGKTTKNQRKKTFETLPEMWYSSRERKKTEGPDEWIG